MPGLATYPTLDALRAAMSTEAYCGLVVRDPESVDPEELTELAKLARAHGARIALDLTDADPLRPRSPAVSAAQPGLVVGESLTGYEIPFGAFIGTHDMFAP